MSTEEDRERGLEALLRQTLRQPAVEPSPDCLDGETLAAWSEGVLPPAEVRVVEAHAAGCARCQAMLAAFARTGPPGTAAAEPAWRRWHLRWLVPIAATATALAVWVAVPSDRRAPEPLEPASLAVAVPDTGAAAAERAAETGAAQREAAPSPPDAEALRDRQAERRSMLRGLGPPAAGRDAVQGSPETVSPPSPNPAAPPQPTARDEQSIASRADANAQRSAPDASESEARASLGRAGAAVPSALASASPAAPPAAAAFALEIVSPDPNHRWRVSESRLEHSTDGGGRWTAAAVPDAGRPAQLAAGSAPGPATCWIAGGDGVVLLTTDGVSFRRVAFPDTVDLTMIRAEDARRAVVTAADGRTFETADGGATWSRR